MPITRKTAAEFATDLKTAIQSRNSSYDTEIGPVADLYIQPTSNVLELQNDRIRQVQQLLSLINDGSFTDSDLDAFVYNELLIRSNGGNATVTLIFSRSTTPTSDITISAKFPVATLADEQTGTAVTFLTLADATLVAANAASYFNTTTQRYELQVAAQAVVGTSAGNVGPNRITRPLRPLNGFDTVFNRDAAVNGKDKETNDELISRYYLSLVGSSPSVVDGISKNIRDEFSSVLDSHIVFGNDPLNVRAATDGGAVDVYVVGSSVVTFTESIVFPGAEQVISLSKQPVLAITTAGTFTQGTDFILVKDTSGYAGSVRASDGIKWLGTGTLPTVGAAVSVTYTYNALLEELQNAFTVDKLNSPARDLLFKAATEIDIQLAANIKFRSGFNVTTSLAAVTAAISAFINSLGLNANVEVSDIQQVARSFSAVDNFVITNIARPGNTGTTDVTINANEYARILSSDLVLTVV